VRRVTMNRNPFTIYQSRSICKSSLESLGKDFETIANIIDPTYSGFTNDEFAVAEYDIRKFICETRKRFNELTERLIKIQENNTDKK
jgi:hypothetical protein